MGGPGSGRRPPKPTTYNRSIRLPEKLRDQMTELAVDHERTVADEIRHALRIYVGLNDRQKHRMRQPES